VRLLTRRAQIRLSGAMVPKALLSRAEPPPPRAQRAASS